MLKLQLICKKRTIDGTQPVIINARGVGAMRRRITADVIGQMEGVITRMAEFRFPLDDADKRIIGRCAVVCRRSKRKVPRPKNYAESAWEQLYIRYALDYQTDYVCPCGELLDVQAHRAVCIGRSCGWTVEAK